jgi:hypothetical protein
MQLQHAIGELLTPPPTHTLPALLPPPPTTQDIPENPVPHQPPLHVSEELPAQPEFASELKTLAMFALLTLNAILDNHASPGPTVPALAEPKLLLPAHVSSTTIASTPPDVTARSVLLTSQSPLVKTSHTSLETFPSAHPEKKPPKEFVSVKPTLELDLLSPVPPLLTAPTQMPTVPSLLIPLPAPAQKATAELNTAPSEAECKPTKTTSHP